MSQDSSADGLLFSQLPTPALLVDLAGQIVRCNEAARALFELDLGDELPNVIQLLTHPERARLNPLEWMKKWAESPDAPELDYVVLNAVTRSGAEKLLSVRVARIATELGSFQYLVCMHDISVWQKRLQNERGAHRVAARLLSITADAVLIADEGLKLTYANESAERMFEYEQGALLGQPLNVLIPTALEEQHGRHIQKFREGKQASRLMSARNPVRALTSNGREIEIDASITRINTQAETVYCALIREKS